METSNLYNIFGKNLYRIGMEEISLNSVDVDPDTIISGSSVSITAQPTGLLFSGKTLFDNSQTGYILGLDNGVPKLYVGTPTDYFNFTGTSIVMSGAFFATSGTIGGWTINATSIYTGTEDHSGYTANAGDLTIYSDGSDASIHAKNFYIDTAGALYCTSANVSGALTTSAGSTINGTYIDSLDVSKLNAGTITSKTITLAIAAGTGDVYIASGKTDFTNVQSGFILGMDDDDLDKSKFYIGDATNYLNWDATNLTVTGIITAVSGSSISGTATDTFTINSDLTDANVDLIFGRTTGGNATLRWNGTILNSDVDIASAGVKLVKPFVVVATTAPADYICDGTADDVQIQAAIDAVNAAGGGIVFIKTGTYDIQIGIVLCDNLHLIGAGYSTILKANAAIVGELINDYTVGVKHYDMVISDMVLDSNNVSGCQGLYIGSFDNLVVERVKIMNINGAWGVHFGTLLTDEDTSKSNNLIFRDCEIDGHENGTLETVIISNTNYFTIDNIRFYNCTVTARRLHPYVFCRHGIIRNIRFDDTSGKYIIIVLGSDITIDNCSFLDFTFSALTFVNSWNIKISKCTFSTTTTTSTTILQYDWTGDTIDGTWLIGDQTHSKDIIISGCKFKGSYSHILLQGQSGETKNTGCSQVTIVDNAFEDYEYRGISIGSSTPTQETTDIIISNNRFYKADSTGGYAIALLGDTTYNTKYIIISGNIFRGIAGNQGFVIGNYVNNIKIEGNNSTVYGTAQHILLTNDTKQTIISNNFSSNVATYTMGAGTIIKNNRGLDMTQETEMAYVKNTSGGDLVAGNVVVIKADADGYEVTITTTQGDDLIFGMLAEDIANDAYGYIQTLGKTTLLKVDGTTDIAIGDFLGTFTSAGIAMKAASGDMAFAIALEAYTADDSSGVIDALLIKPRKYGADLISGSGTVNYIPLFDGVNTLTNSPIYITDGNLMAAPTGDVIFDPTGNDILPNTGYDLNIGSLSKKYLTLHAAELWVETLVAQNTIATIGGRILVGPTTVLTSDLTTVATTIYVKHNEMASGDRVYMEANGAIEFMSIDSAAGGAGPYSYTVTRNLDGTGANAWSAGDAIFNTGTTGDGFIDVYSVAGVKAGTEYGPTIAGNVRNSATFNDWTSHWAIGNLNGLYGYGATTYGAAFGEYAASKAHLTIDSTNGIRFFTGTASVIGQWSPTGGITVGSTSTEHISISSTAVQIKDGATVYTDLTAGALSLGDTSNEHTLINSSGVALKDGANVYALFAATTTIGLTSSEHISISSTAVQIKDSTNVYTDLAAGVLTLGLVSGGEYMTLDGTNGIKLYGGGTENISLSNAGVITIGEVGASKSNVLISGNAIYLRTNTTNKITLGTDGNISLDGSLAVGTTSHIRGGQTAFNTGTGFFLGYSTDAYKFSIGNPASDYFVFDGADIEFTGTINNALIAKTFTAGHAIAAGDAVFVSDGASGYRTVISNTTVTESISELGTTEDGTWQCEKAAQSVTPTVNLYIKKIVIQANKNNTPTDDLEVALQADSAGVPSGTDLAVTAAVDIPSAANYDFIFSTIQTLTANTKYWFVVRRTGALGTFDNYNLNAGNGYVGGTIYVLNDGVWADRGVDLVFSLQELLPSGYIGKAEADVTGRYESFVGFASEAIAMDASGKVAISGVVTGLSGLTPGRYYLSDTAGAISTSVGTNTRKVGIAISATALLVTNLW